MSGNVYANGNEIVSKAGLNKVIAAFPDVCLSPPSPPAGPIPIPYPDTSFSKDLQKGAKNVKISNKPVGLAQQSYYKSSPLGNEAATRSFGANVLTHQITGKTYFQMWSMDIIIEGKNACRHLDICTCNHASYPGGSLPMTSAEKMAIDLLAENKCPCCGETMHAAGTPMNMEEWYVAHNPGDEDAVRDLLWRASERPDCSCEAGGRPQTLLPKAPCDVFFPKDPVGDPIRAQRINAEYRQKKPRLNQVFEVPRGGARNALGRQRLAEKAALGHTGNTMTVQHQEQLQGQLNHLTPKSAGGCPDSYNNLEANHRLCASCQLIDEEFAAFQ